MHGVAFTAWGDIIALSLKNECGDREREGGGKEKAPNGREMNPLMVKKWMQQMSD